MNYFVEGLQGSGKSTLVKKLAQRHPECTALYEGDYSPVELAWCAYVTLDQYEKILEKYSLIRSEIEAKTTAEGDRRIICYTRVITDIPGFHKDLEQYEIYNNRVSYEMFRETVVGRFARWHGDGMIFECSLFQNIVEDMILFRNASDEEILEFYKEIASALEGREYRIFYIETPDIRANLEVIRKERSDEHGNEMWFPVMLDYFDNSPYAKANGLSGEEGLLKHLQHRQALELRICREVFPGKVTVLRSKEYRWNIWFVRD